ncbi:MAG: glycosyltransferase family 4 protein [Eggerthellaceae bacterium]
MNVLILTKAPFPFGTAYSTRIRAFSDALLSKGVHVTVLGYPCGESANVDNYFKARSLMTFCECENESRGFIAKLARAKKYAKFVDDVMARTPFDIVICSSMYDRVSDVLPVVKSYGVPFVLETCEWFQPESWRGGILSPHYRMFARAWHGSFLKADGYIAISKLLAEHYALTTKPVCIVPTILDTECVEPRIEVNSKDRLNLLFAGSFGGGKDTVDPFFSAVASSDELTRKVRIVIAGPTRDDVHKETSCCHCLEKLEKSDAVAFLGRVSQEKVEGLYREADFGCFSRPNRRSSNAGFSTKLGEGMAVGTPFIVNNTGDIADYVMNGVSGYVLDALENDALACLLKKLVRESSQQRSAMRSEARAVAEEYFDYRAYADILLSHLLTVIESHDCK